MFRTFDLENQLDHGRADVEFVADQLSVDVRVEQSGAHQTDVTVMEGGHLVAEVRKVPQTVVVGGHEFRILGGAVGAGGGDTHAEQFAHQFGTALFLNGKGDFLHGEDGVEAFHLFDIGLADVGRILSAGAFGVDKGTFQMNAGDLAVVLLVGSDGSKGCGKLLFGQGQSGGQKSGDTFGKFVLGHDFNALFRAVAEVKVVAAVAVDIHKTGHGGHAASVDDGDALSGNGSGGNLSDLAVFDKDVSALKINTGGNETAVADDLGVHIAIPFIMNKTDSFL